MWFGFLSKRALNDTLLIIQLPSGAKEKFKLLYIILRKLNHEPVYKKKKKSIGKNSSIFFFWNLFICFHLFSFRDKFKHSLAVQLNWSVQELKQTLFPYLNTYYWYPKSSPTEPKTWHSYLYMQTKSSHASN